MCITHKSIHKVSIFNIFYTYITQFNFMYYIYEKKCLEVIPKSEQYIFISIKLVLMEW